MARISEERIEGIWRDVLNAHNDGEHIVVMISPDALALIEELKIARRTIDLLCKASSTVSVALYQAERELIAEGAIRKGE